MKIHPWMLYYVFEKVVSQRRVCPQHVFLTVCDHFEPLWNKASDSEGLKRVHKWVERYPNIVQGIKDTEGNFPRHTFFYPIEEYRPKIMKELADFCNSGYGEVEIHLHHDNDTPENLKKSLVEFKLLLFEKYGLLCRDRMDNEIKYGFIHGNWALDNSRRDGRRCGINNEISILKDTGCYGDFTMPSAPDETQTTKINSIYYAIDDPKKPKSHNKGNDVRKGTIINDGLLMVQGPLALNIKNRKWGILPRIENGDISHSAKVHVGRLDLWMSAGTGVKNRPDCVFIKLYTHGCQEQNAEYLLGGGLKNLFKLFLDRAQQRGIDVHFVTAREMVNVIKTIENGDNEIDFNKAINYRYIRSRN